MHTARDAHISISLEVGIERMQTNRIRNYMQLDNKSLDARRWETKNRQSSAASAENNTQLMRPWDPNCLILETKTFKISPKRLPKSMKKRGCVADAFLDRFGTVLMVDFGCRNHKHIINMVPEIEPKSTKTLNISSKRFPKSMKNRG